MRITFHKHTLLSAQDVRLLSSVTKTSSSLPCLQLPPRPTWPEPRAIAPLSIRGAKTQVTKKLKELAQGAIQADPLPVIEAENATQYPTVIQGVRNNMVKFSNCVVITRVGNFYELYLQNAEECAPLLNLKLAWRKTNAGPVAMAGFPFWQLDRFLKILVQDLNRYVAISEEFPVRVADKVKSGGLMFDRRVTRVVTPGTLIDEKFIDPYENNFLLALHIHDQTPAVRSDRDRTTAGEEQSSIPSSNSVGLAWLDLSTGDFFTQPTTVGQIPSAISRIGAREIILDAGLSERFREAIKMLVGHHHQLVTYHECSSTFTSMSNWDPLMEAPLGPGAEAAFSRPEKLAGHHLLDYVQERLFGLEMKLQPPQRKEMHHSLVIDRNSLSGLEIVETARDGVGKGSLLHTVRRTTTKSGARLLRDRLTAPSASLMEINQRLDLLATFINDVGLKDEIVMLLSRSFDVQRLVQKFSLNKGGADDMVCLAHAIDASKNIRTSLSLRVQAGSEELRAVSDKTTLLSVDLLIKRLDLDGPVDLGQRITTAIDEDGLSQKHRLEEDEAATVAAIAQEVVLNSALPKEIDLMPKKLRAQNKSVEAKDHEEDIEDPWIMSRSATEIIARLHGDLDFLKDQKQELAANLRQKLKTPAVVLTWKAGVGHIVRINGAKVSLSGLDVRIVASTKTTRSFYLSEWSDLGNRIDQAKAYIRNEESRIFAELRYQVIRNLVKLRRNAAVLDELDVACSFATMAQEQSLVRPILNTGTSHKIVGGQHPTVKIGLESQGRSFVSNDLFLDEQERVWLVTGPNMGGKSTFLRQNALITILAQVGSYVPAEHAEIGIVDQIFSRIGAADDLFRDQSTFMVEMLETAAILRQATPRSFVIMDEVGRGTTPEDGTAVGFACLHHLYHINKCRTLFATHFHALADMTEDFEKLGRYCTDVHEDESGCFSFLHRLTRGVNKQSHALKVARLAGLPDAAIEVAGKALQRLLAEKQDVHRHQHLPLSEQPLSAVGGA